MGSMLLFGHVDALMAKKERIALKQKQIAAVTRALARVAKLFKRGKLDLEDAVIVLEMMAKHPRRFLKELKAVSLKYDKYGHHRGLD